MILMMLMTNFENLPDRKNDKSCCVHKRNNLAESVDLSLSLYFRNIFAQKGVHLFAQNECSIWL